MKNDEKRAVCHSRCVFLHIFDPLNRKDARASLALAVTLCGCGFLKPRPPARLLCEVDISDRTAARLTALGTAAYKVQLKATSRDLLEVATFAHSVDPGFEGHPIRDRSKFNMQVGFALQRTHSGLHTPTTRIDKALAYMAERVGDSKEPCFGVVVTDGGIESAQVRKDAQRTLRELSTNKKLLGIAVIGVLPEHRRQWQEWVGAFGNRAWVRGLNDYESFTSELPVALRRLTDGR